MVVIESGVVTQQISRYVDMVFRSDNVICSDRNDLKFVMTLLYCKLWGKR